MDEENNNGDLSEMSTEENLNGLHGFAIVKEFLTEDGWHPEQLENEYIFRSHFLGSNGDYRCYSQIRIELEQFIFYAVAGVKVPEERRGQVAEYITRANYGLRIGNFEMDYSDGEIRYKSSLDFEGEHLSVNWLKHAIYPAVQTIDRYMPGIMGVIYGDKSPQDAIKEVES